MSRRQIATYLLLAVVLVGPFVASPFWARLGVIAMATALAALGTQLLVGIGGQVSLAHAVFVGTGAYLYVTFASEGGRGLYGLGWPTLLAFVLAVLGAGALGVLFVPIASRLRGLQLAIATIGLGIVFTPVLQRWQAFSGGYSGRQVPELNLFGLRLSADTTWNLLGTQFKLAHKLWYLCLLLLVLGFVFARRVVQGRPGLALRMIRESEIAASALGVRVLHFKIKIFVIAALYGGVSGVLLALANQYVVPTQFNMRMSVDYVLMIIIGGRGSVRGALFGAAFVTSVPILLQQYSEHIPFVAPLATGGVDANIFGIYVYASVLIIVIMFARGGIDSFFKRLLPETPSHVSMESAREATEEQRDNDGEMAPVPTS